MRTPLTERKRPDQTQIVIGRQEVQLGEHQSLPEEAHKQHDRVDAGLLSETMLENKEKRRHPTKREDMENDLADLWTRTYLKISF